MSANLILRDYQRVRLLIAIGIALVSGLICWSALKLVGSGAGDFTWSYVAAHDLLAGRDPYRYPTGPHWTPYPLPAALVAILFAPLRIDVAGAVFFGLSSGLLAYGLTKKSRLPLLVFLSCPYGISLLWAQWTPLIVASAFFPILMGVFAIKPHIAAPIVLTRFRWSGIITGAVLLVLSLLVYPTWPFKWFSQLGAFEGFVPLFTIPGPLLLLAIKRRHQSDARYLLIASLFPQRWFYDALILWLIPKTRKEFLFAALISWLGYIWRIYQMPSNNVERGVVCVFFLYLPMLLIVLRRPVIQIGEDVSCQATSAVRGEAANQPKLST